MMACISNLSSFLRRKDGLSGQLVKYILCGGVAVAVDTFVFYLLAWLVFPCLRQSDPMARLIEWVGFSVQEVGADELKRNYWIIKGFCFLCSNIVVYVLNVLFVFNTGRHRKPMEILLFFGSSLFQFFFIWLGGILITLFKWEVTYANIAMLTTSLLVNFVVRKKLVFKS
ncbi:MAG: GtrA family protein [Kiritimatiellales bacterium]|nr:GtrA family protein [Kiritimatiellales bacterium]